MTFNSLDGDRSPMGDALDQLANLVETASVTKMTTVVPWEDSLHIMVVVYPEGKTPATLVLGKLKRDGRKWRVKRARVMRSLMSGEVAFEEEWSEPFSTQGAAIDLCTDALFQQGQDVVDEGIELMERTIAEGLVGALEPADC